MNPVLADNAGGAFRIGDVLVRSWRIFAAHWFKLLVLFVGLGAPHAAANALWASKSSGEWDWIARFSLFALGVIFNTLAESLLVDSVIRSLRSGTTLKLRSSLRRVLPRYSQLFLVEFVLEALAFGGMLLLFIPGLIIATRTAVAFTASVVEGTGVFASISRSNHLVRNHSWPVFGIFVGYLAIVLTSYFLIVRAFALHPNISDSLTLLTNSIAQAFYTTYAAILYTDLRAAKEGLLTEPIAEIFD